MLQTLKLKLMTTNLEIEILKRNCLFGKCDGRLLENPKKCTHIAINHIKRKRNE